MYGKCGTLFSVVGGCIPSMLKLYLVNSTLAGLTNFWFLQWIFSLLYFTRYDHSSFVAGLYDGTWFPHFCILILCIDMLSCRKWYMLSFVQLVMTFISVCSSPGLLLETSTVLIGWPLNNSAHNLRYADIGVAL